MPHCTHPRRCAIIR